MSNRRILGFSFVAASVAVFVVFRQFTAWFIDVVRLTNWAAGPLTLADIAALVIVVGTAIGLWRYPKVHQFLVEVVEEISKVVWPSRQETRDSTIVVIVFVFVIAAILGGFDLAWAKLTNLILTSSLN